ncbi:MAG: hypothetical protein GY703_09570 [Gammaproteobacteria bacterium]|nr:hypothetical protein [Gammaproteobacteria bacterium]
MDDSARNLSALHVDDLFCNSHVLHLQTQPGLPSISETWYCARDICELLGRKWNNGNQNLKSIPEHDKAMLSHQTAGGCQNVWALSKSGVLHLHCLEKGCYPLVSDAILPTHNKGVIKWVINNPPEENETDPTWQELLAEAKDYPSPLRIMLLLDALTPPAVKRVKTFLENPVPVIRYRGALQVLKLIMALSPADREEVVSYLDWLVENPS